MTRIEMNCEESFTESHKEVDLTNLISLSLLAQIKFREEHFSGKRYKILLLSYPK